MPVTYAQATYVRPGYVRPVAYTQPTYCGRPVVANYYTAAYWPVNRRLHADLRRLARRRVKCPWPSRLCQRRRWPEGLGP